MKIVGINIKRLREEKKITLRELSKKLKVSASFLSQVETGKASPSLVSLKDIANALQTTVGDLMGENQIKQASPVVKAKERKAVKHIGSGVDMYLLAIPDPNKQMEALLFRLERNASSGDALYKHFGQEFVLILEGALELTLNDIKHILKKGDTIYFNSNVPHLFRNLHKGTTEALWVVTPPSF